MAKQPTLLEPRIYKREFLEYVAHGPIVFIVGGLQPFAGALITKENYAGNEVSHLEFEL